MKPHLLLGFLGLLATLSAATAQEAARTWTNTAGQTVTATLASISGDTAKITLADGTPADVPISSLSQADQDYLKAWVQNRIAKSSANAGSFLADLPPYDGPPAEKEWPRTMSLDDKAEVTIIIEDDEKREFRYETEHYEFWCDSKLGSNLVREFSRIFEATYQLNCLLPLDFRPQPERLRTKFLARIFTEAADYMDEGGIPGSAGVYMSGKKALMLPMASLGVKKVGSRFSIDYNSQDYRTLIHEITHQMMTHWLGRLPTWYTEGAAEYVELTDYSRGKFSFIRQDDNLKEHLSRYGAEFPMVPLQKLLTIESAEWAEALSSDEINVNYPSALALTYYFYHLDGEGTGAHMIDFLRAVEQLERPSEDTVNGLIREHLMRGREAPQLEEDVSKALRKLGIKVTFG